MIGRRKRERERKYDLLCVRERQLASVGKMAAALIPTVHSGRLIYETQWFICASSPIPGFN